MYARINIGIFGLCALQTKNQPRRQAASGLGRVKTPSGFGVEAGTKTRRRLLVKNWEFSDFDLFDARSGVIWR